MIDRSRVASLALLFGALALFLTTCAGESTAPCSSEGPPGGPGCKADLGSTCTCGAAPSTPGDFVVTAALYGAAGDGKADDTAAIQKAISNASAVGGRVILPPGRYRVTGLSYGAVDAAERGLEVVGYGPSSVLEMASDKGFVIGPGPQVSRRSWLQFRNFAIDMKERGHAGLVLEASIHSHIERVRVLNVPGGSFEYDQHKGADALPRVGILIKGYYLDEDHGSIAAYNRVVQSEVLCACQRNAQGGCEKDQSNRSMPSQSAAGLILTSSGPDTNGRANFNELAQVKATLCNVGIHVLNGSDNVLNLPEVSRCRTGIRIGTGAVGRASRNVVSKPYTEVNDIGILVSPGARDTEIRDWSSVSETGAALLDQDQDGSTSYSGSGAPASARDQASLKLGDGMVKVRAGKGDPASVTGSRGSLFLRTDGSAGAVLYVREPSGWVPK